MTKYDDLNAEKTETSNSCNIRPAQDKKDRESPYRKTYLLVIEKNKEAYFQYLPPKIVFLHFPEIKNLPFKVSRRLT
jgi:hypothetical protein